MVIIEGRLGRNARLGDDKRAVHVSVRDYGHQVGARMHYGKVVYVREGIGAKLFISRSGTDRQEVEVNVVLCSIVEENIVNEVFTVWARREIANTDKSGRHKDNTQRQYLSVTICGET